MSVDNLVTLETSWITVCVGLLITVWLCGMTADLGFSIIGICETATWLVIGISILVISELGTETELDSTELELIETLETWLELLKLTVELELDDSILDAGVCEFLLWELKMIALPDKTKIEVMTARMILSLFDIELA